MSRRRAAVPRKTIADPKHNDVLISKFINVLMGAGKKSVARRVLYNAMDDISQKESETPSLEVVKGAVEHVKPTLEVKSRRVGLC